MLSSFAHITCEHNAEESGGPDGLSQGSLAVLSCSIGIALGAIALAVAQKVRRSRRENSYNSLS